MRAKGSKQTDRIVSYKSRRPTYPTLLRCVAFRRAAPMPGGFVPFPNKAARRLHSRIIRKIGPTSKPRNMHAMSQCFGQLLWLLRRSHRPAAERYRQGAAERTPSISPIIAAGVKVSAGTDATRVASYNPWASVAWPAGKTVVFRHRTGTPLEICLWDDGLIPGGTKLRRRWSRSRGPSACAAVRDDASLSPVRAGAGYALGARLATVRGTRRGPQPVLVGVRRAVSPNTPNPMEQTSPATASPDVRRRAHHAQ
jgi:hypothetical protein